MLFTIEAFPTENYTALLQLGEDLRGDSDIVEAAWEGVRVAVEDGVLGTEVDVLEMLQGVGGSVDVALRRQRRAADAGLLLGGVMEGGGEEDGMSESDGDSEEDAAEQADGAGDGGAGMLDRVGDEDVVPDHDTGRRGGRTARPFFAIELLVYVKMLARQVLVLHGAASYSTLQRRDFLRTQYGWGSAPEMKAEVRRAFASCPDTTFQQLELGNVLVDVDRIFECFDFAEQRQAADAAATAGFLGNAAGEAHALLRGQNAPTGGPEEERDLFDQGTTAGSSSGRRGRTIMAVLSSAVRGAVGAGGQVCSRVRGMVASGSL